MTFKVYILDLSSNVYGLRPNNSLIKIGRTINLIDFIRFKG